jgi:hypothetical protein
VPETCCQFSAGAALFAADPKHCLEAGPQTRTRNTVPTRDPGCPISRSFFARCGIPRLSPQTLNSTKKSEGCGSGIPHLAKNERDMGHPGFLVRTSFRVRGQDIVSGPWSGHCFGSVVRRLFRVRRPDSVSARGQDIVSARGQDIVSGPWSGDCFGPWSGHCFGPAVGTVFRPVVRTVFRVRGQEIVSGPWSGHCFGPRLQDASRFRKVFESWKSSARHDCEES